MVHSQTCKQINANVHRQKDAAGLSLFLCRKPFAKNSRKARRHLRGQNRIAERLHPGSNADRFCDDFIRILKKRPTHKLKNLTATLPKGKLTAISAAILRLLSRRYTYNV